MMSIKFNLLALLAVASFAYGKNTTAVPVDELIAVVQLFRHGQRTPVSFYPTDPYSNSSYWPVGPGQLTNVGKRQHYWLGHSTRARYNGFLPIKFSVNDFNAQTTDVDRTHMSAQSDVAGIYPPIGSEIWELGLRWQPIPIHVADPEILNGAPDCNIYILETANVLANAEEFKEINEKYADLYKYLSVNTGTNVTSVLSVEGIRDSLLIEDQFGYKLPKWTDSVYPTPLDVLSGYGYLSFSYTTEQKRLAAGRWLYEVIEFFQTMISNSTSNPKYQLYSAHDSNIAATLNTLGAFIPHAPAFASNIYIELWNRHDSPVVNVWHRNGDNDILRPVTVKGCDFNCNLSDFKTVLSDYLVDSDQWEAECAANSTALTDLSTIHTDPYVLQEIDALIAYSKHRRQK